MTAARLGRARGRLLVAAAALLTAWLVAPHAVPLYDGIGVPDEPYRYVKPPAGYQQTPPPSTASVQFAAAGGTNPKGGIVQTKEITAQSQMYFLGNGIKGPATAKTFTITITPEAPDGTTPGTVDGNVYRIAFLADGKPGGSLSDTGRNTVYIQRATSAKVAAATLYYRPIGGSGWTAIPDTKGGTDSFQGYFAGPGDYALVPTKAPATSQSHVLLIVILVLVVLAMAGAVVLIRLSRRPPTGT